MFSKFISKVVGEKGQWREYEARARKLPAGYRTRAAGENTGRQERAA